ncbi:MAG TPA: hypothetical protein VEC93_22840, partial [Anaerolineae bacterium]|nr:hypothetical protein [Anaerolineae bacterium]
MTQQTSSRVRHRRVHIAARFGMVVLLISSALGLDVTPTRVAYANSIVVNTTLEAPTPGGGLCSLRSAILNANADLDLSGGDCSAGSGADTITLSVTGTITPGSALPDISEDLTIAGPGAANLTISGSNNGGVSIFVVSPGITFKLQDLTVANANTVAGGGIFNAGGTVNVITSTFSSNTAQVGGGISNTDGGTLTVTNSTFSSNTAEVGGGIFNTDGGTLTVANSTFDSTGRSTGQGGGIFNDNGVVSVTNSTFSENFELEGDGAGIYNAGTLTVATSTFSGNNTGGGAGGGIYNSGTLDITDSTFSGNSADFGVGGGGIYNSGTLDITDST